MSDADTGRVKHTYVELSARFVEEVGEAKAREFAAALQRAHGRIDANDHDRARELVDEESRGVGVRVAEAEAAAFADQLLRFDRVEVLLPGEQPPTVESDGDGR